VQPSVVFIDADHHYEPAKQDILTSLRLFPDAVIVGDDWRYPGVQRAVKEIAKSHGKPIHVEGNTCWTFTSFTDHPTRIRDLETARSLYGDSEEARQGGLPDFFTMCYNAVKIDNAQACQIQVKASQLPLQTVSRQHGHKGRTLLMLSARNNKVRAAKALLDLGAEVDFMTAHGGESALHIAAKRGDLEIIGILLRGGASKALRNKSGKTAQDIAEENGHSSAASELSVV
jgi:hypothetical protein